MSDMTINEIRKRRAQAEEAISDILLRLCIETGLGVEGVQVRKATATLLNDPAPRIVEIQATIVLTGI